MMLFGGERDGQVLNEMWRFHFATEFWEKLSFASPNKPMPRAQSTAFIFSQFITRGAVHYMGLPEQDYFGSQPDPEKRSITTVPVKDAAPANCIKIKEESLYEEIDESKFNMKNTYSFAETDNCLVDEEDTGGGMSQKIYDKLPGLVKRQPNNFQRMVEPQAHQQGTAGIKAKMSNMNLSKMSAYSNYSMFSNESTESLNTSGCTTTEAEKLSCHTVTETVEESPADSPVSVKLNFTMKKSQSMVSSSSRSSKGSSSGGSVIPRDKSLQSFTQALIHADPESSEKLKLHQQFEEENIYETVPGEQDKNGIELADLNNGVAGGITKRSDSSYTFQSYDYSSSRSSTLSSTNPNSTAKLTGNNRVLPPKNSRLIDLELDSGGNTSAYYSGDDMSSMSGYESIEGNINNITANKQKSSSSNNKDSLTSFSNPNYLCPDAKTMLEKQQKNRFGETILPPTSLMTRDESHQTFAAALNSPAESLISDYQVCFKYFLLK
jgi:hypothetical protein